MSVIGERKQLICYCVLHGERERGERLICYSEPNGEQRAGRGERDQFIIVNRMANRAGDREV